MDVTELKQSEADFERINASLFLLPTRS